MKAYKQLEGIFDKVAHLEHLGAIAGWDEAVMMPTGGGKSRAQAMAYLGSLKHEMLTSSQMANLLDEASQESLEFEWQTRNLALMQKKYTQLSAVPSELIAEVTEANILAEQAWRQLRADNNWLDFVPLLKKNVFLAKEVAQIKAQALSMSVYDVMLDDFSPELSQQVIEPIFGQLKSQLPEMMEWIIDKQKGLELESLAGHYPHAIQKTMAEELMQCLGFDFVHGRLDESHHPFCGGVADDVRITTRFNEDEFISAIMGVCHETGHALYELGLPRDKLNQPIGQAYGMAMHESQSLLVEMQVCRSRHFMPVLQKALIKHFGKQPGFGLDNIYNHYTRVEKSFIRVDADEVTYPLHVILRYEIEQALFTDKVSVEELPELWDDKMQHYLGLSTGNDYANGVMQDVHWACGLFGYFPAYTFGALIAAQLYQAACEHVPEITACIEQADMKPLMQWLGQYIHSQGSAKSFDSLLFDATGCQLSAEPFLSHIRQRYLG